MRAKLSSLPAMAHPAMPPPQDAPLTRVRLVHEVAVHDERFRLEEETMPESLLDDDILVLLQSLLRAWATRAGCELRVARNLACRWDPADARFGVDPDLCLIEPPPPGQDPLKQLWLWEGHAASFLAIEVVSGSTATKDYLAAPVNYARLGTRELWMFDPLREGPADTGGPFVLQVWRRDGDHMERAYSRPAQSPELGAWLVVTDGGRRLRLAEDAAGTQLWPTQAEAEARHHAEAEQVREKQAREQERAAREQERAAREKAEAEVAELRAQLAALPSRKS